MGCQPSRPASASDGGDSGRNSKFGSIGDSVHVMLEHDKKVCAKKGQSMCGYVPRQPHPLLDGGTTKQQPAPAVVVEEEEEDTNISIPRKHRNESDDDEIEGRTVDLSQADESVAEQRQHKSAREAAEEARRRLLWHTAHHCATVDPRDVRLVSSRSSRIPTAAFVAA